MKSWSLHRHRRLLSDETSVNSTSSTPPVAPPTPFAGGYRGSKHPHKKEIHPNDEGSEKEDDLNRSPSCESSPSPIPICPPPPKDLLLPTSTSSAKADEDDDEDDVILADEVESNDVEVRTGGASVQNE